MASLSPCLVTTFLRSFITWAHPLIFVPTLIATDSFPSRQKHDLVEKFQIPVPKLVAFLRHIQAKYNPQHYHNVTLPPFPHLKPSKTKYSTTNDFSSPLTSPCLKKSQTSISRLSMRLRCVMRCIFGCVREPYTRHQAICRFLFRLAYTIII